MPLPEPIRIRFRKLVLPLKYDWSLSRNSVSFKTNFLIEIDYQGKTGWGEVAPNIRYAETPEATEAALTELAGRTFANPEVVLNAAPLQSLRCGLECALINSGLLAFPLALPEAGAQYPTAYTVPVMAAERIEAFYQEFELRRFTTIKLKVTRQGGAESLAELARLHAGSIWLDANEAFDSAEEFLSGFSDLTRYRVTLVEQPFRKENVAAYTALKGKLPCVLVGDESLGSLKDIETYGHLFDAINIKIQKAGGLVPALACLDAARAMGLKVMIGCMVETSVGIRESLKLAPLADYIDLDSFLYLKEEPFKLLAEEEGKIIAKNILYPL